MILDEATAPVDTRTERSEQRALELTLDFRRHVTGMNPGVIGELWQGAAHGEFSAGDGFRFERSADRVCKSVGEAEADSDAGLVAIVAESLEAYEDRFAPASGNARTVVGDA